MSLNLTKWYEYNYKRFDDDIVKMTVFLSKRLKSSPYEITKKLAKVRRHSINKMFEQKRQKQKIIQIDSKWSKYLFEEMFKRW